MPALIANEMAVAAGEQVRIADVPIKMVLTDQPLAWMPLSRTAGQVPQRALIRDPTLIELFSQFFELLWEQAVPLQAASKDGVRVDTVEADQDMTVALDRTLIRLLATGLSEEAIAGYLNCHQRTRAGDGYAR